MLRIFITNLGKYNEGHLIGEWVNLPCDDLDAVYDRIGIDYEEYEEVFIADYETDIDGLTIGEYSNIDELNELAETLEDMDEYDREVIGAMMSEGYSLEEAINRKADCIVYYGCSDMTDVAEQYCEECGILDSIPENLRYYFDYEAFGRDMSFEGHYVFTNNGDCVQIL